MTEIEQNKKPQKDILEEIDNEIKKDIDFL